MQSLVSVIFKYIVFFWSLLFVPLGALASQSFLANSAKSSPTPITVQLNWNHQFQFAGFYAAIKQGYYQQAGLDVTVKAWQPGVNVIDEVLSARADYAIGYSSIIADYAKGQPVSLVMASFQFSPMVLLSHEPIHGLDQFSGKSVMHYGNLQINGLIDKANALIDEKMIEIESSGDLNDFINKKVDFYASYKTNEPYRLREEGVLHYIVDPKSFGIQSYGDLIFSHQDKTRFSPGEVQAFREATIRGWQYAILNQVDVVDFILDHYPVKKERPALLAEAEDTTIYVRSGTNPIGHVEVGKLMATAVQAKESGLITAEQFERLDLERFLFDYETSHFNQQELDYLKMHPVIKVGNDRNWAPFEFVSENGEWSGMAAEYFKLFEKQLGVRFEINQDKSWSEVLELAKKGDFDLFSCAAATEERQAYMNFTEPYLSFPMVLATKQEVRFIEDARQLEGRRIAAVEGYWSHENLQKDYAGLELLVVDSVKAGLEAVISGQAYAYSGNLASINYVIKQYGLTGLHIAGQLGERFELAIGVQKENPVLFGILNKALTSVTEEQHSAIYNHWIQLEMVKKTDRAVWVKTVVVGTLIFIALLLVVIVIHRQKRKQQAYIKQINELSLATYINAATRKMEWVSDSFTELSGYDKNELLNHSQDLLRHPSVSDAFYDSIWTEILQGKVWQGELKAKRKNGLEYWVQATVTPEIVNGQVKGVWTTRVDISDKKHLEDLAIKDALTEVYNRHHFNEVFETELNRANRKHDCFAMAIFDIDFFKQINDCFGHQKGDEVLKQVVNAILEHTHRAGDLIFRVGGEEFVVLSDSRSEDAFFQYLELLRESVEDLAIPNPKAELKTLSISIGGVFCQRTDQTKTSYLYSVVDKALYEAKNQGRNQVVMHII
ncbi:MAG: diguanylate cyclase [Pseudomonadota bacterium]|nr:diguanylate cyclase [Pseudomonadota bacterium]